MKILSCNRPTGLQFRYVTKYYKKEKKLKKISNYAVIHGKEMKRKEISHGYGSISSSLPGLDS